MGKRVALAMTCALLACAGAKQVGKGVARELNPFSSTDANVNAVAQIGPYLLVELRGAGANLSLFAPATPACASVLRPEAAIRYEKYGIFGRLSRDEETCAANGAASLAAWRDRTYRRRGTVVPRAHAQFTTLFEGPQLVLLRGRFPLAGRVGIPAGYDLVAMVPNNALCRPVVERGVASLEYREAGPMPFSLVTDNGPCPVLGFAEPPQADDLRSAPQTSPHCASADPSAGLLADDLRSAPQSSPHCASADPSAGLLAGEAPHRPTGYPL